MDLPLDEVKILPCKVCNKDVPVNVAYPITEVTCKDCYRPLKKWQKCLRGYNAPTRLIITPYGPNSLQSRLAIINTDGNTYYKYNAILILISISEAICCDVKQHCLIVLTITHGNNIH